jgi:hypothetical protein
MVALEGLDLLFACGIVFLCNLILFSILWVSVSALDGTHRAAKRKLREWEEYKAKLKLERINEEFVAYVSNEEQTQRYPTIVTALPCKFGTCKWVERLDPPFILCYAQGGREINLTGFDRRELASCPRLSYRGLGGSKIDEL